MACKLMHVRKIASRTPIGAYKMTNRTHKPSGNLQQQNTPINAHQNATAACMLFYLHDGCLPAQVESLVKIFQHLGSLCLILHGYGLAPGNSSTA